jgi:hypothetical protein
MIFAKEIDDNLTSLVKKLDAATAANKKSKMGSFVVFTSDDEGLEKKLEQLAKKEDIKNIVLTIDNPAGPRAYKVAKDAAVTVVFYVNREVKANHVFKKGELTASASEKILADLPKIVEKN